LLCHAAGQCAECNDRYDQSESKYPVHARTSPLRVNAKREADPPAASQADIVRLAESRCR
jgi:hypothetical protein